LNEEGAILSTSWQVTGTNADAPFTLKIHRGDGMVLLAMNWRTGQPPRDFAGFAIEYREPGGSRFFRVHNRIGFPGQRVKPDDPTIPSTEAPIQKFRWVHVPRQALADGTFRYRVTPKFMDPAGKLTSGPVQEADLALMRETLPGRLNVAFTRGFVSSQAFVDRYGTEDGQITTLIPALSIDGLTFLPTHPKATEAYDWMGFEARTALHQVLDDAIAAGTEVRVIAYDLNLPDILTRLEALGPRLRIIIDNSGDHADPTAPESQVALRLMQSAGAGHVTRQHMSGLQHHKSIAVAGLNKVVYGSTNFTWRGMFVQSNNALIVTSPSATADYFAAFDTYATATRGEAFRNSPWATGWRDLGLAGVDARVGFSPHNPEDGLLAGIGADLDTARSSVFFSLAFLGQMTRGPIGPALGRAIESPTVHTLGIADARVSAGNLGVTVLSADGRRRIVRAAALTGHVPPPFSTEPSGLSGTTGESRGTRMHHKFLVLDFDTDDARVYLGSYNFSQAADLDNGENLLMIRDRTVATSYMIEALRIYDHYRFRAAQEDAGDDHPIQLHLPPATAAEDPWWQRDWDDPLRRRDRELFA
jgi:PLD-like domain